MASQRIRGTFTRVAKLHSVCSHMSVKQGVEIATVGHGKKRATGQKRDKHEGKVTASADEAVEPRGL